MVIRGWTAGVLMPQAGPVGGLAGTFGIGVLGVDGRDDLLR